MQSKYEWIPHGTEDFRVAVFSEKVYGADLHHHSEYAIFYLAEGKMDFFIEGTDYTITAGDIVFVEPNQSYSALRTENNDEFHYYALLFDLSSLGDKNDPCRKILQSVRVNRFITLNDSILAELPYMREWDVRRSFGDEIRLKNSVFKILTHILDTGQYVKLSAFNRTKVSSEEVNKAVKYIEEHYKEKITLDDILENIQYSKSHFLRIFKQNTGMNPVDYMNRFRIEKACLELLYTKKTITEIALNNGFSTVQYFTGLFGKSMGQTPGAFRKAARSCRITPPFQTKNEEREP